MRVGSTIEVPASGDGHADADDAIMRAFAHYAPQGEPMPTSAKSAIEGHLLAFAAEEARISGDVIAVDRIRAGLWAGLTR